MMTAESARMMAIETLNRSIGRYDQLSDMAEAAIEKIKYSDGSGIAITILDYLGYVGFYDDTETDQEYYDFDSGIGDENEVRRNILSIMNRALENSRIRSIDLKDTLRQMNNLRQLKGSQG
tara:strand:+ start:397 stop:759 length:363 start_codon:yes stop_codon:yes gene_type:complete